MYKIRQTTNKTLVEVLHLKVFGPKVRFDGKVFWIVSDNRGKPVGYATCRASTIKGWAFLALSGILPEARGHRLQRRLIKVRERWARKNNFKGCLSYVVNWNSPSLINLLKLGYTIYDPCDFKPKRYIKRDGYVYVQHAFKKLPEA